MLNLGPAVWQSEGRGLSLKEANEQSNSSSCSRCEKNPKLSVTLARIWGAQQQIVGDVISVGTRRNDQSWHLWPGVSLRD